MSVIQKLPVNGLILLDKPEGLSSNTALQKVKRLFQAEKAGHAGTLDPMATGMLPICLGQATKLAEYLLEEDKCYEATLELGALTTTGDREGEVLTHVAIPALSAELIEAALAQYRGVISQVPPMYSALKHQGQALYELARKGIEVERKARQVQIYELKLLSFEASHIRFSAKVSKGTYIRTLGEDIAKALGTVGHLSALRRVYSGGFDPAHMQTLLQLQATETVSSYLIPMEALLLHWQPVSVSAKALQDLLHGKQVQLPELLSGQVRLLVDDKLVAIAKMEQGLILERKMLLGAQ